MQSVTYVHLNTIEPAKLLPLLNREKIREHLIEHPLFDTESVKRWVAEKEQVDSADGCRVRAILVEQQLAGWCGLQQEGANHEIAIVLDDAYWGLGKQVFHTVISWAKEFGHATVLIHFLHTRPGYRFLHKQSIRVYDNALFGQKFTTYELDVAKFTD